MQGTVGFRSESFPRAHRLRSSVDFRRVQARGRKIRMTNLMAIVHRAPVLTSRIGLAVSRKVGNAVHRNKVKRWIREASRRSYSLLSGAWDIVFIAHAGASDAGFDSISSEVRRVFQRVAEMKRS